MNECPWLNPYGGAEERGKANRHRERLYFSPGCLSPQQGGLFE